MADTKIVFVDPVTGQVNIRLSAETVEGIEELIQVVVLSLLNISGQAALDPEEGGGLPELIGTNFGVDDPQELFAEVQQRVNKTQSEVREQQVGLDLDPEAKLKELKVISIEPGGEIDRIAVRIRLINELGRIQDLSL